MKELLDCPQLEPPEKVKAESYIWFQGDPGLGMFLLLEGEIDVLEEGPNGELIIFRSLQPGETAGELSSLDGGTHSATLRARTDCKIRRLAADAFRRLLLKEPSLALRLLERQNQRIRQLTEQLSTLGFHKVKTRVARWLAERDQDRIEITHHDLAAQVAATRESVTKALRSLAKGQIISSGRGSLEILDRPSLQREAGL